MCVSDWSSDVCSSDLRPFTLDAGFQRPDPLRLEAFDETEAVVGAVGCLARCGGNLRIACVEDAALVGGRVGEIASRLLREVVLEVGRWREGAVLARRFDVVELIGSADTDRRYRTREHVTAARREGIGQYV